MLAAEQSVSSSLLFLLTDSVDTNHLKLFLFCLIKKAMSCPYIILAFGEMHIQYVISQSNSEIQSLYKCTEKMYADHQSTLSSLSNPTEGDSILDRMKMQKMISKETLRIYLDFFDYLKMSADLIPENNFIPNHYTNILSLE